MKNLFEATITLCADEIHCGEEEVIATVKNAKVIQNKQHNYNFKYKATDLNEEMESQTAHLHKEKKKLNVRKEYLPKEGRISSKCFDGQQNDIMVLNGSMDSNVPANQTVVKGSLVIDSKQYDLEVPLSELLEENVLLSERISGLEPVLRYID